MRRKPLWWPLAAALAATLCFQAVLAAASLKVGGDVGNLKFNRASSPGDHVYLGLAEAGEFTLKDIHSPYILIEVLRSTCPFCLAQAPAMNNLFNLVQGSNLRDRLKFMGVGESDYESALEKFKTDYEVPFPLVSDPHGKIGKALRIRGTPTTVVLDRNGKVLFVHQGVFREAGQIFKKLQSLLP
jgi:peroxiredoxin